MNLSIINDDNFRLIPTTFFSVDLKYRSLKMYDTYIPNAKFNSIKFFLFCDMTKIWIKSNYIKDVKNNSAEKSLTNWQKKN